MGGQLEGLSLVDQARTKQAEALLSRSPNIVKMVLSFGKGDLGILAELLTGDVVLTYYRQNTFCVDVFCLSVILVKQH